MSSDDITLPDDAARQPAGHVPVMLAQVLELLAPRPGQIMLDCTVGRGGHAAALVSRLAPDGRYIALDVDPGNLEFTRARLQNAPVPVELVRANFAAARAALDNLGVKSVDLLLADLGFSSNQMGDPARGFSFGADGPLDMRLDPALSTSAADLVANLGERELADLIFRYGEERLSRRIARKIVERRERDPILTTAALADVVRAAYGAHAYTTRSRMDPATRTFQALRIAVNAELESLEQLTLNLPRIVGAGGAAAIISFHSLEDRIVKQAFARMAQNGQADRLTRKPWTAGEDEVRSNPRSRSAKLRAVRFLPGSTPG